MSGFPPSAMPGYPPREPAAPMQGGFPSWPFAAGQPVHATLTPPDIDSFVTGEYLWRRTPLFYPNPFLVYSRQGNIAHPDRDRIINDVDGTSGSERITPVTFDVPGVVVGLSGSCNTTDGSAFPLGWTPLSAFSVSFTLAQREKLTTQAGLAETILGTAALPRWLVGDAWPVSGNTVLQVGITPHLAHLRITVNLLFVETRGPTNVAAGP